MTQTSTPWPPTLLIGLVGALLGVAGVVLAAKRNQSQPIEQELAAERRLASNLLEFPLGWFAVEELLLPEYFTDPAARATYEALFVAAENTDIARRAYRGDNDEELEALVTELSHDEDLLRRLNEELLSLRPANTALAQLSVHDHLERIVADASTVLGSGIGRTEQNTAASPFVADPTTHVLSREKTTPNLSRVLVGAVLCALSGALGTYALYQATHTSLSLVCALASLVTMIFASVEVACVDIDTFYLDSPVLYTLGATSWLFAALAALADHHPSRVIAGVVTAVATAVTFEVMARLFAHFRGHTQGAGDTWIALLTVGVPAALTGSWRVGLYSIIAGSLLMVFYWTLQRLRRRVSASTPIPFGPFLAAGWVLALAWWSVAPVSGR